MKLESKRRAATVSDKYSYVLDIARVSPNAAGTEEERLSGSRYNILVRVL